MSKLTKWGGALFIVCVLIIIADHVATILYPTQWGGPNIGGGFIVLLALIGAASGIVLLTLGIRQGKGKRR